MALQFHIMSWIQLLLSSKVIGIVFAVCLLLVNCGSLKDGSGKSQLSYLAMVSKDIWVKFDSYLIYYFTVKGFYPKWSTDKTTPPASEWAVSEINVS